MAQASANAPAKRAALFVHGFMGTGRQFGFLADAPALSGYAVHVLTLAGHGGTLDAFTRSGGGDWQRSVDDALASLRAEYDAIHIIGHSMGGLLAIRAAVRDLERIERITALALPFSIHLTARGLRIRMRALAPPRAGEGDEIRAAREMCGVSGITPLRAIRMLPNSLALLAIMRRTRGVLGALRVPLTLIHSQNDELVSARTCDFVRKAVPAAAIVVLRASSHFHYTEADRQIIRDALEPRMAPL